MMEKKSKTSWYVGGAIGAVVIIIVTVVFPVWNLLPNEVTEKVKVVSVDSSGCTAETSDGYVVKIGQCNAKPGDSVLAKYDAGVKTREQSMMTGPPG